MSLGGFLHSKSASNEIDRNTTLCLACSSSLPPLKGLSSPSTSSSSSFNLVHITQCCQRPICPLCISSNPRLARYDPCLACLGGVGVVKSQTTSPLPKSPALKGDMLTTHDRNFNLDGSLRDEDTFVLGEDDNDDETDEHSLSDTSTDSNLPPSYDSSLSESIGDQEPAKASTGPCKYYLKRSDTLMGICLRFGVDSHEVCKLNNLPTSVMRTTPHLLHTRAFIILPVNPKTSQYASAQVHDAEEKERIRRREENLTGVSQRPM
ncbi:hypothetical protein BDN70DRAFT_849869 [Pholiota conissans]|uniref:LysM domain-containing protein n=1 Tax=Pholiota conissans TaxID=109636 RepID=A0A9P6CXP9_9AGAR|nr:hypothetical protein BDN70DRAFT_849869 [Pholiota conissans]